MPQYNLDICSWRGTLLTASLELVNQKLHKIGVELEVSGSILRFFNKKTKEDIVEWFCHQKEIGTVLISGCVAQQTSSGNEKEREAYNKKLPILEILFEFGLVRQEHNAVNVYDTRKSGPIC